MKSLLLTVLALTATASFAQSAPKLTINDELFREVIELNLSKSPLVFQLGGNAMYVANAEFANRMCSLKLEIKAPTMSVTSSFSRTSKNLEKCKEQIAKFIVKNI